MSPFIYNLAIPAPIASINATITLIYAFKIPIYSFF